MAKDGSFTIDRGELDRHWPKLAHLAVAKTFRELDEDEPVLGTISYLRRFDPRSADTLQITLRALRDRGHSLTEIAKILGVAASTIARWEAGTHSPAPSSPLVLELLNYLKGLPDNGPRLSKKWLY